MTRLSRSNTRTELGRRDQDLRQQVGREIGRLRTDAGLSEARLADAAGINQSYLCRIESGDREPSLAVLLALAEVLGADLAVRLYPRTGPLIRDHIQAAIVEALLAAAHPRWKRLVEVPVYRPARGVIDVVLSDPDRQIVVAVEVHSQIHRLEQQLRWAAEKADSLPSAQAWPLMSPPDDSQPRIARLIVIRSTRANRELAKAFETIFSTAFPARSFDVHRALTSATAPWPGSGVMWASVEGGRARIL